MSTLQEGIVAFESQDYLKAFGILYPIAEQGDAEAQCIIANIYHLGLGIEKNGTEAIKWYLKSARQGYAIASNNLAGIFLVGDCGVTVNQIEAARWYQLSREQGFSWDLNSHSDEI